MSPKINSVYTLPIGTNKPPLYLHTLIWDERFERFLTLKTGTLFLNDVTLISTHNITGHGRLHDYYQSSSESINSHNYFFVCFLTMIFKIIKLDIF